MHLLLDQLYTSLCSKRCWRVQKDLTRLRHLSLQAALEELRGCGPLAELWPRWHAVLAEMDPGWCDYVFHLRELAQHVFRLSIAGMQQNWRPLARSPSISSIMSSDTTHTV